MEKRYQVFISSTYTDLIEERNKTMKSVMDIKCIPAGMELFPANNMEQFEYIKKIIDDSDYYVLIIGGRYGSLADDGISYTEKEFDYAMSRGIPVLAFLHSNVACLPSGNCESDSNIKEKLEAFREKARTGRVVNFWSNADELCSRVIVSLTQIFTSVPAVGWIRANLQTNTETLQEMNELRKELAELVKYKAIVEENKLPDNFMSTIAGLDDEIILPRENSDGKLGSTWRDLFASFAPKLIETKNDYFSKIELKASLKDIKIDPYFSIWDTDVDIAKVHLSALGLIDLKMCNTNKGGAALFWSLTKEGKAEMYKSVCIKK